MGGDEHGISRRYARALFNLAVERNEIDSLGGALRNIAEAWQQNPQLKTVLAHPKITRARKTEILTQAFGGANPEIVGFLTLLVDKDRAGVIPYVAREFNRLVDEHRREADAEAVTAVPMSEAQVATLKAKLEAQTGLKLRLTTRVDESILGGLIVRVGDRMMDDSAATKLDNLRERLRSVKVT